MFARRYIRRGFQDHGAICLNRGRCVNGFQAVASCLFRSIRQFFLLYLQTPCCSNQARMVFGHKLTHESVSEVTHFLKRSQT